MAAASNRKTLFIIGFFAVLALVIAVLIMRDIPAPVAERVVEVDAAKLGTANAPAK